jgi:major type 1 subunit fimbrin (pilin)
MKKILLVAAAVAGLASIAPAFAADGTITINGSVTSTTCTITGGGNVTVALPAATTAALATNGAVANRTPFAINLTGCAANTKATAYFEPAANIDATTGNLRNATGAGNATNVQVQLFNADTTAINLAGVAGSQNSKQVTIGTAAPMNFYAGYYATGQATAGTVTTSVMYTLQYQ